MQAPRFNTTLPRPPVAAILVAPIYSRPYPRTARLTLAPIRPMSLRIKLILFQTLIILLTTGLVAFFVYQRRSAEIFEDFQTLVKKLAGTAALNIPAEDLAKIRSNEDTAIPEFKRVEGILNEIRRVNGIQPKEIYILRPTDSLFDTEFVAMTETPYYVGNRYLIAEENRSAFQEAFETGQPQFTALYNDEHGTWISGYGAIRDSSGKPVAILEIDSEVGRFLKKKNAELLTLASLTGLMTLLGLGITLGLTSPISSVIERLTKAFGQIANGEFPKIETKPRKDELGRVVEGFNDMSYGLHLSQYQMGEALKSLNSVSERAPALFMSADVHMAVLVALENLSSHGSMKTAEITCTYVPPDSVDGEEQTAKVNAWTPDAQSTSEETFPLVVAGQTFGSIHIRWKQDRYPVDIDLARVWASHLAAVLATRQWLDERSRAARSEAMEAASSSFMTQLEDIQKTLEVPPSQTPTSSSSSSSAVARTAKRIEVVKQGLSMLAPRSYSGSESRPFAAIVAGAVNSFIARHGTAIPIEIANLGNDTDAPTDAERVDRILDTVLEYACDSQLGNPPSQPRNIHLTLRSAGGAYRIIVQSNGRALSEEEATRLFTDPTAPAVAEGLLSMPTVRLSVEAMGGSIEYVPGPEYGALFTIRLPMATHEAA